MDGYNRVAGYMSANHELAIVRRFDALAARNLLIMQAEVANLEDDQISLIFDDKHSSDRNRQDFEYNVLAMKNADPCSDAGLQWQRVLETRTLMADYCALPRVIHCGA